jgi:hypothetical protein
VLHYFLGYVSYVLSYVRIALVDKLIVDLEEGEADVALVEEIVDIN